MEVVHAHYDPYTDAARVVIGGAGVDEGLACRSERVLVHVSPEFGRASVRVWRVSHGFRDGLAETIGDSDLRDVAERALTALAQRYGLRAR